MYSVLLINRLLLQERDGSGQRHLNHWITTNSHVPCLGRAMNVESWLSSMGTQFILKDIQLRRATGFSIAANKLPNSGA